MNVEEVLYEESDTLNVEDAGIEIKIMPKDDFDDVYDVSDLVSVTEESENNEQNSVELAAEAEEDTNQMARVGSFQMLMVLAELGIERIRLHND